MKISELKPKQSDVDVEGTIVEKNQIKKFSRMGSPGRVCSTVLKDDSGKVTLTLWNDEVEQFEEGDKVKVKSGYVKEFRGVKQLSSGRSGSLEKVE